MHTPFTTAGRLEFPLHLIVSLLVAMHPTIFHVYVYVDATLSFLPLLLQIEIVFSGLLSQFSYNILIFS